LLILARVLQGAGGGGMQPLAQAILLESFPPQRHGVAMAVYGIGVVVAPVVGPTLGGWITDSYSWRWIFYINLPVGLLALLMINTFVEDPPYLRNRASGTIDYLGFGFMALWLGALQLVLDKGQEVDWFSTRWICWTALLSTVAFLCFIARELNTGQPIVHLSILSNRNFLVGTIMVTLYSVVLYGITSMLPLFLQVLMGYPALQSGMAVSPRGIGSILSMVVAGVAVSYVDERILLACGFGLLGVSSLMLSHLNLEIAMSSVVVANLINGFAGGLIFVPLTTMAMGRLPRNEIGNAAGIYNLMRNIGGSVGIASMMTCLVRGAQKHQAYLSQNVTPGSSLVRALVHGLQTKLISGGTDAFTAHRKALGMIYGMTQRQASLLSYIDNFRLLGVLALICCPLPFFFVAVRKKAPVAKMDANAELS
jgi:DHA2 family multidrug resistance protein